MRTTIDLPDPLFRQLKAQAALEGRKLKDLVTEYVARGVRGPITAAPGPEPRRSDPPILIPPTGQAIPLLTNAELEELLQDDRDLKRFPDLDLLLLNP
jgi:hypothetical protein